MKKNRFFLIFMIIVSLLLLLAQVTGMTAHIMIALWGLLIMIVFTLKTKNEWNNASLELLMRFVYISELITGAALMRVPNVANLSMLHKACAALFIFLLLVLYIPKCRK